MICGGLSITLTIIDILLKINHLRTVTIILSVFILPYLLFISIFYVSQSIKNKEDKRWMAITGLILTALPIIVFMIALILFIIEVSQPGTSW
jgi:hypothetical protein